MAIRISSRPPSLRVPTGSSSWLYPVDTRDCKPKLSFQCVHHREISSRPSSSPIHHTSSNLLRQTHRPSITPLTSQTTQKRTIRILPIGKRKHPKHTRFNNHPQLPTLGSTPLGAYERRLASDTLPLRTGALAVKRGMTAIYVDATGLRAAGADANTINDSGKPPNDPAGAGSQAADGLGGASRASRSKAGTSEEAFAMTGGRPAEGGRRIPATVLQLDRCQVVGTKTREKHGYFAVVVGEGWRKPKRVGKAMMGHYAASKIGALTEDAKRAQEKLAKSRGEEAAAEAEEDADAPHVGLPPKRETREFKVKDAQGLLPIGTAVPASWFQVGQYIDARGTTRGMGFAGGMKRHGFHGQPASHGVSLTHRSMGSAGGGQGSGSRVHPGKKMAGNMGNKRHTIQNLRVLMVDEPNGLVVVQGAVSGRKGDLVMLSDALKKPWPKVDAAA